MILNAVIAFISGFFSPNQTHFQADYITVVEDRPIMSVKYCLLVHLLLLAKIITHPAARSLCDSWASCIVSYTVEDNFIVGKKINCIWQKVGGGLKPRSLTEVYAYGIEWQYQRGLFLLPEDTCRRWKICWRQNLSNQWTNVVFNHWRIQYWRWGEHIPSLPLPFFHPSLPLPSPSFLLPVSSLSLHLKVGPPR